MTEQTEVPKTEESEISPEEAQRVLQVKRAERVRAVERGIQALCEEHRCLIDVQITLSLYGQPQGRIVVLPRD